VRPIVALLSGLMFVVLTACTLADAIRPQPTGIRISPFSTEIPQTLTPPEPGSESGTLTPSPPTKTSPVGAAVTHYAFEVILDYDAKELSVSQIINYTNDIGRAISDLPILVPPAHQQSVFTLTALNMAQTFLDSQAKMEDALIQLTLNPPLEPGQRIEINIEYQLHLPQGWTPLGYTQRQVLLADWYPLIPPYQESIGWLVNPPGQVGEYLVYPLSNFHLNLCLAPSREELIVAASVPLSGRQDGCYQYNTHEKRNISLGISPHYHVSTVHSDLVTVTIYSFPQHASLGERAAELAVQSWTTFTELYGGNQREHLSIVEADIADGLETDGLIFLSEWYYRTADPSPQNYFELLIVHETAHQWFYGYIHNDQANEPWLDEALSTYSEVLFYEIHYPHLVDWWWDFRVTTYAPGGPVNAAIYEFRQVRPYINVVYLRGASFLQALRNEVGDQAFFESLRHYTQIRGEIGGIHTSADFFEALRQVSDHDLSAIIAEFFQ
jgi:hypothetical protein